MIGINMTRDKKYTVSYTTQGSFPHFYVEVDGSIIFDSLELPVFIHDTDAILLDASDFFSCYPDCGVFTFLRDGCLLFDDDIINSSHSLDGIFYYDNQALIDTFQIENSIPLPPDSPSSAPSLNGNGCEFMDGSKINVNGRSQTYTVQSSFFFLIDDNTYTPLYSLQSDTGSTLYAPETLCTPYIAPVTTP